MQDRRTRKVDASQAASKSAYLEKNRASITVLRGPIAGAEFEFDTQRILVGRSPSAAFKIDEDSVSQEHAIFELDAHGFGVRDLGSTNGVRVNGAAVQASALKHGDRISLGSCELQYVVERRSKTQRTWVVDDA